MDFPSHISRYVTFASHLEIRIPAHCVRMFKNCSLSTGLHSFVLLNAGQPKRHLLTTGWSLFVSGKRLLAGDSVLFIR